MSGGAVSNGRLWWAADGEFELAEFDKYKFDENMNGPTVAVMDGLSFAFQLQLCPKGGEYSNREVRDHMGVGIALVDGPVDELADFKFNVKVYKADGSFELSLLDGRPRPIYVGGYFDSEAFPMAADQLKQYVMGEAGSEFVKVRVDFGFPQTAFDARSYLPPPAPRQDLPERFGRWCREDNGIVYVVAGDDGRRFTVYKDVLSEASDVFKSMLDATMQEGSSGRIEINDLCTDALDELLSFMTSGATRPSRLRAHVLKLLDASQRYLLDDLKCLCERTVVEKMQEKKLTSDFLDLLKAAEMYELRVAKNVGLCRLLKDYPQLSDQDKDRLDSADFKAMRHLFMNLTSQTNCSIKC